MKFITFTDSNKNEMNLCRIYNLDKIESFAFAFSDQIDFATFTFLMNENRGVVCDFPSCQEKFEKFKGSFLSFLESEQKLFNINDFSLTGEVKYQFVNAEPECEEAE